MARPISTGWSERERERRRATDARAGGRGVWRPWGQPRKFEGWSTTGGRALARQMVEPKPKPEPEPIIVRMVEAPSPHHYSQFAADIIEPSYSELIHDRRVLDLLPVIEDQTFDPFWDGWGSFDMEQNIAAARRQRRQGT